MSLFSEQKGGCITFDFTSKVLPHRGGVLWTHYKNNSVNSLVQNLSYYNQQGNFSYEHNFQSDFSLSEYDNKLIKLVFIT